MTRHLHDPDVSTAEWSDLADAAYDARPTHAELDDSPEPILTVPPVEACAECEHLLCLVQRTVERRSA